jgi:hypothetical protein
VSHDVGHGGGLAPCASICLAGCSFSPFSVPLFPDRSAAYPPRVCSQTIEGPWRAGPARRSLVCRRSYPHADRARAYGPLAHRASPASGSRASLCAGKPWRLSLHTESRESPTDAASCDVLSRQIYLDLAVVRTPGARTPAPDLRGR